VWYSAVVAVFKNHGYLCLAKIGQKMMRNNRANITQFCSENIYRIYVNYEMSYEKENG
jgi:hypothetical protein